METKKKGVIQKNKRDSLQNSKNKNPPLGVFNENVVKEIVSKSANAYPHRNENREKYEIAVQSIFEMQPKDPIEAKLHAKESSIFSMAMEYMRRAENAFCGDDLVAKLIYEDLMKNAIKLLKLHNETVDVISRYKRQGEQRVIVQHVNVEGGQNAFMTGNFQADGGGKQKSKRGTP